jgi:tetratricopeptide (TPR) repeat protein
LDPAYLTLAKDLEAFDNYEYCYSAAQSFETGKLLESEGKIEEAISAYNEATKLDDSNAVYWNVLANAYRQIESPIDAEEAYKNAVANDKTNDNYIFGFGTFYLTQGRYDRAIEQLLEAIKLNDTKVIYFANLGEAYRLKNESESDLLDAVKQYSQAIELDKEFGDAHCGLGISYHLLAQVDKIEPALTECLSKSKNKSLQGEAQAIMDELSSSQDTVSASEQEGEE